MKAATPTAIASLPKWAQNYIRSLQADKNRLDWLEQHPGSVYASLDAETGKLEHYCAVPEKDQFSRRGFVAKTARAAK